MTESEFDIVVYRYYRDMLLHGSDIDEYDLMWMAAMRCAMEVDRERVRRYCDKEKPLTDRYRLQRHQFTAFKRIATRDRKAKEVDLKWLHDQFSSKTRKECGR